MGAFGVGGRGPIMTRRRLLGSAAGVAGIGLAGAAVTRAQDGPGSSGRSPLLFHSPDLEPYVDELPRPPVLTGETIDLAARTGSHRFHRDLPTAMTLGYGASGYLGPTIEARSGVRTTLTFRNEITAHPHAADIDTSLHGPTEETRTRVPTSLHLHGGVTEPASDGHPELISLPCQGNVHHFDNRQDATGLWYHDHAMPITRLNVHGGLAGGYLLRDRWDTGRADNPLGLPAGEYELPLILQEKIMNADGSASMRSTPIVPQGHWEGGAVGDVGVVNGKIWPTAEVARGLYRLRMVNAASFSNWMLHLSKPLPMWVIGMEGGLLPGPAKVDRFRLAPGERADVLVDFSALAPGETVELLNTEPAAPQAAQIGAVHLPTLMRFRATSARGHTGAVPDTLRGGSGQPAALAPLARPSAVRTVSLSQPGDLRIPPSMMSLNNLRWTTSQIEMPRQGSFEMWNIVNATPDPHAIHIHLVHFRVLSRQAIDTLAMCLHQPQPPTGIKWTPDPDPFVVGPVRSPEPWESGMKDTVICDPNSVTRVLVHFPTADELGFDPDATFPSAVSLAGDLGGTGHAATGHDAGDGGGHGVDDDAAAHGTAPVIDRMGGDHVGSIAPPGAHHRSDTLRGYVWHCHILDHEDHDMMLPYRTVT
ncbi:multicopper oxidase family protein [Dietzia sp. UBA5065]|nr:multicopper oxidase domain-containing protein [Dietzia sp. UBA5065]